MSRPIAGLLSLAVLLTTAEARAGGPYRWGWGTSQPTRYGSGPTSYAAPAPADSYSYYVAGKSPARSYAGYDAFPFYGQPYGHAYDPWTWPYLSGSYSRSLVRYYDPPVK
jgi:hypothetical protein